MSKSAEMELHKQYELYEKLPVLLKRYSFQEKMDVANFYSRDSIAFNRNISQSKNMVLPWCLESFVMFSMEAHEYNYGALTGKNDKKALEMLNAIWAATSKVLKARDKRFAKTELTLFSTCLSQFRYQEIDEIIKYRYWYLFERNFEKVPLKEIFDEKMHSSYEEYLLFGEILKILFFSIAGNRNVKIQRDLLDYIFFERFPMIAEKMTISREAYVELQRKYIKGSNDKYKYVYSLCPSIQYPLVRFENKVYLPLPHLLQQCVTSSLMYRITEDDNSLREKIGKHVLEQYLQDIVSESGAYDEVCGEQDYGKNGEKKSPDVIARNGKDVLFLDSKSTVPGVGLRILDVDDIEKHVEKVGKYISKLARHMLSFEKYNPFKGDCSMEQKDHWGVVVLLEDSYIPRQFYYEKAKVYFQLDEIEQYWDWVEKHVKVTSLYEIEKLCLSGRSVLDACEKMCLNGDVYAYPFHLLSREGFVPKNSNMLRFINRFGDSLNDLICELEKKKLL